MNNFDAARWIADAFAAGVMVRVDRDGNLVMDMLHADPDEADRLDAMLEGGGRCRAVIALLPRPGQRRALCELRRARGR